MSKFIHLLYVPTMNCNMKCRYCYLGENTVDSLSPYSPLQTLSFAVEKFRQSDVIPFSISLHGGEVTTLGKEDFRDLIEYIHTYYTEKRELLKDNGFKVGHPHIKTNLFGIGKHIDTIKEFDVSISGSLDLPFSLHRQLRVTKGGKDTLGKIFENIELLKDLPNKKKVSATIFKEHFDRLDEIVTDIKYLHENTCLDMNDFNFMVGFNSSESNSMLTELSEDEQVELFNRMNEEFSGTDLQKGLDEAWFAEFTQYYCSNCDICGEKFFLLERNGDIYSCVRGQGHPDFYYGNIYKDDVETILKTACNKIFTIKNRLGFDSECAECGYLYLCKTGCPFVKNEYSAKKSYTCLLQQEIYKKNNEPKEDPGYSYEYLSILHPEIAHEYIMPDTSENSLYDLIKKDPKLQKVYDSKAFILEVDNEKIPLESQITKASRDIIFLTDYSNLKLYIRHDVINALSPYPVNNSLYMMLLSGNTVIYGDEQREKQEHIMTHQIYKSTLAAEKSDMEGHYCIDLMPLLSPYFRYLPEDRPNNLFFTTADLRDYHYLKQKNNAYYHIAAMNLPFQNIEFYYHNIKEVFHNE